MPTIEIDIKEVLDKLDRKLDGVKEDIADLKAEFKEDINGLKVSSARQEENSKRLEDKIDNLSKRLDSVEFLSRGVLIGLIIAILGAFIRMLGFGGGNP